LERHQFSHDELILTLVSLVRATDPRMLQTGPDGFTFDLAPLEAKTELSGDERLLLKLRAAFETPDPAGNYQVELNGAESRRLAATLGQLETLQRWPQDVLALSREVRARLGAVK